MVIEPPRQAARQMGALLLKSALRRSQGTAAAVHQDGGGQNCFEEQPLQVGA